MSGRSSKICSLPERRSDGSRYPRHSRFFSQEESQRLIDMDRVVEKAVRITEQNGIIFLDELDKVAGSDSSYGPDVSREGVQRDLLPIVEGSTVATKYGMVKTDHVLFIAAGAFNVSKPSDLLPELQGRFPHPGGTGFPLHGRFCPDPAGTEKRPHHPV